MLLVQEVCCWEKIISYSRREMQHVMQEREMSRPELCVRCIRVVQLLIRVRMSK